MLARADLDQVIHALGDPTRRAVYERIVRGGEITVGALVDGARVSQPAVSQHLKTLKAAGLVAERRDGRKVHYRAEAQGLEPLVDWIGCYGAFWRERFANLESLLREIDP